jgi:glycosyltransferase involved in cell wall biosynthesis
MRIALEITGALAGGGFRRYTEMITRALAAEDKKNEYILYGAFWTNLERMRQLDLPRQPNFRIETVRAPQRLLLPVEEYLGLRWQERLLIRLGADIVHGFSNWLPKLDRLPSVLTLHYSTRNQFTGWDGFYFNTLLPRAACQADKVLAISVCARDAAIRDWGLDPAKVEVVYHGAPMEEFKPDDASHGEFEKPYFLFIGVTRASKNARLLMEGFGLFKKRHPDAPHRFVICGSPGDQQAEIEALLAQAGLAGDVTFEGNVPQSEIRPYYRKAVAYVSASELEGFHLPLIEAMAYGVPTVVARGGAQTEIVAGAGLHVDATAEDLARGMAAVAFDPRERARMRAAGLERCKDFSWAAAARRMIAVYEAVYAARR